MNWRLGNHLYPHMQHSDRCVQIYIKKELYKAKRLSRDFWIQRFGWHVTKPLKASEFNLFKGMPLRILDLVPTQQNLFWRNRICSSPGPLPHYIKIFNLFFSLLSNPNALVSFFLLFFYLRRTCRCCWSLSIFKGVKDK